MGEIALTRGLVTQVDDADAARFGRLRWYANPIDRSTGGFYATRVIAGRTAYLHRAILNAPEGSIVDHIDGDGLNNRRGNLRLTDRSGNSANALPWGASGYRGVSWAKDRKVWRAYVYPPGGSRLLLGGFHSPEDAARAYDRAALRFHGAMARLNFPTESPIGEEAVAAARDVATQVDAEACRLDAAVRAIVSIAGADAAATVLQKQLDRIAPAKKRERVE